MTLGLLSPGCLCQPQQTPHAGEITGDWMADVAQVGKVDRQLLGAASVEGGDGGDVGDVGGAGGGGDTTQEEVSRRLETACLTAAWEDVLSESSEEGGTVLGHVGVQVL